MAKTDTTTEKPFDAVRMMRQIRDEIGKQIRDMTFEQEQRYIRKRLHEDSPGRILDTGSDAPETEKSTY